MRGRWRYRWTSSISRTDSLYSTEESEVPDVETEKTRGMVLDQQAFDECMEDWLRRQANKSSGLYSALDWADAAGITDTAEPGAFMTREEAADMIRRALTYFFERMVQMLEKDQTI